MSKSSKIIQFVLKDIQSKIHKFYDDYGIEVILDSLEIDRKVWGTNLSEGWVDEVNVSTLHMTAATKKLGIYTHKGITVSIANKDIYSYKAGDIKLHKQHFGNLSEPGILSRLEKTIMLELEDWTDAKLKHERLLESR